MSTFTLINVISNCTIAFSSLGLLIHILGDPDNDIWDNKIKAYLAKFGLSVTTCGAVLNILTFSTPNNTEILLNVGMSLTFFWLSRWQWEIFKDKQEQLAKRIAEEQQAKKRKPRKTKRVVG